MSTTIRYEDLVLMPALIADVVASTEYDGSELSEAVRDPNQVKVIEMRRSQMTREQHREFTQLVDKRCRAAYETKVDWFMKCARAKSNRGRDQLYVWVRHWLASYLINPEMFRRV